AARLESVCRTGRARTRAGLCHVALASGRSADCRRGQERADPLRLRAGGGAARLAVRHVAAATRAIAAHAIDAVPALADRRFAAGSPVDPAATEVLEQVVVDVGELPVRVPTDDETELIERRTGRERQVREHVGAA